MDRVIEILFPPIKQQIDENDNTWFIDQSVTANLESVLSDLESNINDKTIQITLRDILNRLYEVKNILNVQEEIESIPSKSYYMTAPIEVNDEF